MVAAGLAAGLVPAFALELVLRGSRAARREALVSQQNGRRCLPSLRACGAQDPPLRSVSGEPRPGCSNACKQHSTTRLAWRTWPRLEAVPGRGCARAGPAPTRCARRETAKRQRTRRWTHLGFGGISLGATGGSHRCINSCLRQDTGFKPGLGGGCYRASAQNLRVCQRGWGGQTGALHTEVHCSQSTTLKRTKRILPPRDQIKYWLLGRELN